MIDKRTEKEVFLTKEQTIEEHRKMWNWIADQYEKGSVQDCFDLEKTYLEDKYKDVECDRFCCEYDDYHGDYDCDSCPLDWGSESRTCSNGLYSKLCKSTQIEGFDYKKAEKLARKIANLPERKNDDK